MNNNSFCRVAYDYTWGASHMIGSKVMVICGWQWVKLGKVIGTLGFPCLVNRRGVAWAVQQTPLLLIK